MLPAIEAEQIILDCVKSFDVDRDSEIVTVETATGRILAQDIASEVDFPYWDNSAMDGYAVRYADFTNYDPDNPLTLEVIEEIPAGYPPQKSLEPGQTARIFTGAMLPPGADTIVIQENTQREGDRVTVLAQPQAKQFVRYQGSYYQAGNPMLKAGSIIQESDIAVLATAQCTEFTVYRRPKVAILSTGDELVTPGNPLKPGQIIDSNQYALASFVARNGAIPIKLGIVRDSKADLKNAIKQAISQADIVLSTGGVSVGDYDYVDEILAELGGEISIRAVAVKPGKPLTVATFDNGCLYFGIPGNPVSALVSCWRFVLPAQKKLSGQKDNYRPQFVSGITQHPLKAGGKRETYLWGNASLVNGQYQFAIAGGSHQSANLINLAQTNALAIVPIGEKLIAQGSAVTLMLID